MDALYGCIAAVLVSVGGPGLQKGIFLSIDLVCASDGNIGSLSKAESQDMSGAAPLILCSFVWCKSDRHPIHKSHLTLVFGHAN